jgi:hypothetical protein
MRTHSKRLNIPNAHGIIHSIREQTPAVGTHPQSRDRVQVARERVERVGRLARVPGFDGVVYAAFGFFFRVSWRDGVVRWMGGWVELPEKRVWESWDHATLKDRAVKISDKF